MIQQQNNINPSETARNYIKAFQSGNDFKAPSSGIIINGLPDSNALNIFNGYLKSEDNHVRENIIELLIDVGTKSDTLSKYGALVIRNNKVIQILAESGLAKPDGGRERAFDALRTFVLASDLSPYGNYFVEALNNKPSEEAFLLIGKAKPQSAKEVVSRFVRTDYWKENDAANIAEAALGNDSIAQDYIYMLASFNATENVNAFCKTLITLSLIGTPQTLKVIAEQLRTPLIFVLPKAFKKSVRLNVLESLLYNFPDQIVLSPNRILSENDYTAAENFCIEKFDVKYTAPPPPFLTYKGFPSNFPPRK